MIKYKIILWVLICYSYVVIAQQPVAIHLSEKDGLPDIEFYNIIEDKKGFVWLAADKGFFRYDGKGFKQYTNPQKRGLSVFEPFEDVSGRIWCTNISGQFFYVQGDKLIQFIDLKDKLKGQLAEFIVTKTKLIITNGFSMYEVDLNTKKVSQKIKMSLGLSKIRQINNQYLIISNDSIWEFNKQLKEQEKKFLKTYDGFDEIKLESRGRSQMIVYGNKKIVHETSLNKNYFSILDQKKGIIKKVNGFAEVENKKINAINEIKDAIWVLTNTGAYIYKDIGGNFKLINHFFSNENITKVIIDKDKNYWLATLTNGIFVIPNIEIIDYQIPENISNITKLDKASTSSLFFGTVDGVVSVFDFNNSSLRSINLGAKISSVLYDATKKYSYVATDRNSFFINKKTFEYEKNIFFEGVKSFSKIDNDSLLYCTYRRVSYFSKSTDKNNILTDGKRAYTTYYDTQNKLGYIGYVDNLIVLKDQKQQEITYNDKEILAISITQTIDKTIWVGTFKNGVYAIKGTEVIANYNTSNGLLSNQIEYIQSDSNNLWIATSKGVQVLNSNSQEFKNLTKTDGIPSYKVSGIEVFDDQVFLSSNKGLIGFDKTKVFKKVSPANIYIDAIEINENEVEILDKYNLDYNQNAIKISFNVNGISFSQKGNYQYRLVGYRDNWVTTDSGENTIKYNSLAAGKYTFQVRPIIDGNVNKDTIREVRFFIQKPFWETWWFYLGVLLVTIFSIWKYFIIKIKKIKERQEVLLDKERINQQLVLSQLENLRSQMNPHFIFNALNSIQEYIVLNEKNLASAFLVKFSRLIRMYLEHSRANEISLKEELNALKIYLELEKDRFEDILEYVIDIDDNLSLETIKVPPLFIQPYVENALKHGLLHKKDNRKLTIAYKLDSKGNNLQCLIIDNGIGRKASEQINLKHGVRHASFATNANQKRVELLNTAREHKIKVNIVDLYEEEKAMGTKVMIKIPVNK
ncbi:sensor histidine kinase [uncultured Aquimarina sp.]|uniref:sensor histidine kinase n=1 Tax=uncultured Aquimarina sp. TaxID=575652 RepID=UPI0026136323|nr:sensor histidine kinase [uncultured Aquimarina sp.]